jgi:hypothetical protein
VDKKPDPQTAFSIKATLNKAAIYDAVRAFVGAPEGSIVTFRYTEDELTEAIAEWQVT